MKVSNFFYLLGFACICVSCANISSPTGGKKDRTPPKLISVTPVDSQLNARITKLELRFDEYITLGDASKEITISPILPIPPVVTGINKHVTLKIEDSLLEDNTTYRISFGSAIRDLHEGNPFTGYTYMFSTCGYFDSLQLNGKVLNAETGYPDTSGVVVVLYRASENDSAIVKLKPRYITRPDNRGNFTFKGLPRKRFRIYAVKDESGNMIYDGGNEMIAFNDSTVVPGDTSLPGITLRLFTEVPDTLLAKDSVKTEKKGFKKKDRGIVVDSNLTYTINIDTSDIIRRTFDVTDSIKLVFNRLPLTNIDSIRITRDSAGRDAVVSVVLRKDSTKPEVVYIVARLADNTVYTLHLDDGFSRDTSGKKTVATEYRFRTFNDNDYGKITLNLPGKFYATPGHDSTTTAHLSTPDYVLAMMSGGEIVYRKKITDTVVFFKRVRPAKYTFRIIADKNKNGFWDTGDLFDHKQPEEVVPGPPQLDLKAGWEHKLDFEQKLKSPEKNGRSK